MKKKYIITFIEQASYLQKLEWQNAIEILQRPRPRYIVHSETHCFCPYKLDQILFDKKDKRLLK